MPYSITRLSTLLLTSLFAIATLLLATHFTRGDVSAEISSHTPTAVTSCLQPPPIETPVLAMYVLAYDNDPTITNTFNLAIRYAETVQEIANATAINSDVRAVILADLDSDDDTHMLSVVNGSVNPINCLPDETGRLVEGVNEFDTTDGATLGGFFTWANDTYPATRRIVSYIGHGTFFAPETGAPIDDLVVNLPAGARQSKGGGGLSPLPYRHNVNSFYTDFHVPEGSADFIKPHDLAVALAPLTENGDNPIDVLDLLHCFAASTEEFYEVHDYAVVTVGSPNYAWYREDMPGAALSNFAATDSANDLAADIMQAYDAIIPADNLHPSVILSVDNSKMQDVKNTVDAAAAALLGEFDNNAAATIARIDAAYTNSRKYDTTFCDDPAELQLAPPDQLSDISDFFDMLSEQSFDASTKALLADVFIAVEASNGSNQLQKPGAPEFYEGMGAAPQWNFGEEPYYSIFTPFEMWTAADGNTYHSWQSLWYTATPVYEIAGTTTISNPFPFQFLQSPSGAATWADVIFRYWHEVDERPGADVNTAFCGQPLRPIRQQIRMKLTVNDNVDPTETGETIYYTVGVTNSSATSATQLAIVHNLSPLTQFTESDAGCFVNGASLVCPIGTLPPNSAAFYTIAALALSPGTATMNAEISVLQKIFPTAASETTAIDGTPLAVGVVQSQASTAQRSAAILTALLTTVLVALIRVVPK